MTGRILVIALAITTIVAGAAMYWLQVYAYYDEIEDPGLAIVQNGEATPLPAENVSAIDATSSPIRFRACFTLPEPVTGEPYPDAVPLNAPSWFDCFDASKIGEDLEAGHALAVLGQSHVEFGIDRVLAIYPDGRGYAWQQINACGHAHFDGNPLPEGCPEPPKN